MHTPRTLHPTHPHPENSRVFLCPGTLTRKCLDPSGAASRNCGHNCRHLFDTSILTALLNNLYRYDPDCYRLRSTEQTIIDPRASKLQRIVRMVFAQKVMESWSGKIEQHIADTNYGLLIWDLIENQECIINNIIELRSAICLTYHHAL